MSDRTFIRHTVFFSAKKKDDIGRIVEGLSLLKGIPDATVLEVRPNTRIDQIANDIDVVVYGEFADQAALQAYKAHDLYQRAIDIVRPLRDKRIAVDF